MVKVDVRDEDVGQCRGWINLGLPEQLPAREESSLVQFRSRLRRRHVELNRKRWLRLVLKIQVYCDNAGVCHEKVSCVLKVAGFRKAPAKDRIAGITVDGHAPFAQRVDEFFRAARTAKRLASSKNNRA
jgi:hypothetical protein